MRDNNFLIGTIIALILTFSFIFPGSVSARPLEPGQTPNVWSGKLFPEVCFLVFLPVQNAWGNIYNNTCIAAQSGIRVTWDVYDLDIITW